MNMIDKDNLNIVQIDFQFLDLKIIYHFLLIKNEYLIFLEQYFLKI